MRVLVVKSEFKDYKKGDRITDETAMKEALETHSTHVVASNHPEETKE